MFVDEGPRTGRHLVVARADVMECVGSGVIPTRARSPKSDPAEVLRS